MYFFLNSRQTFLPDTVTGLILHSINHSVIIWLTLFHNSVYHVHVVFLTGHTGNSSTVEFRKYQIASIFFMLRSSDASTRRRILVLWMYLTTLYRRVRVTWSLSTYHGLIIGVHTQSKKKMSFTRHTDLINTWATDYHWTGNILFHFHFNILFHFQTNILYHFHTHGISCRGKFLTRD